MDTSYFPNGHVLETIPEKKWTLYQAQNLNDVLIPIQLNRAIKYTCIDVTSNSIWCGTNNGSVYGFDKENLKHKYLIPPFKDNHSTLSLIKVHSSEELCATYNGEAVYINHVKGQAKNSQPVEALVHQHVTCMRWQESCNKLIIGTSDGYVFICSIHLSMILVPRTTQLLSLHQEVVQLDSINTFLLVSTVNKAIIYNYTDKTTVDIGKKQRNGYYGAIFMRSCATAVEPATIFCARPGLRLWKADGSGNVISTQNFKQSLSDCPQADILLRPSEGDSNLLTIQPKDDNNASGSFRHVHVLSEGGHSGSFLASVSNNHLYIMDPVNSEIILHTNLFNPDSSVLTYCAYHSTFYMLSSDGKLSSLVFGELKDYIESILQTSTLSQVIRMCIDNQDYMKGYPLTLSRVKELMKTSNYNADEKFHEIFQHDIEHFKDKINRKSSMNSSVSESSLSADNLSHSLSLPTKSSADESTAVIEPENTETKAMDSTRKQSSNSLASLATHSATSHSTRRSSSHTSLDLSVECSGDLSITTTSSNTGKGGRLRALTSSFLSSFTNKDSGDSSSNSLQVPDMNTADHPVANGDITRPRSMTRESSHPGALLGHVTGHVKEGLSKISNRAKTLYNSVKDKTMTSPVADSHASSTDNTDALENNCSGGHNGFFIGDDDIKMAEDMPSSLEIYLKLTRSLHATITAQSDQHQIDDTELQAWCSKLCLLLSQYTIHNGQADTRSLFRFKKFCPWRMSTEETSKSRLLAELCLSKSCCQSINDYNLIEPESETDSCIKDYLLSKSCKRIPSTESLFISVFWFLMDQRHLMEYIEILALSDMHQSKVIWRSLMDCMILSRSQTGEWSRPLSSLSSSELKTLIISGEDDSDYILYVYLLSHLDRLKDLLSFSFSLHHKLSPLYVMYAIQAKRDEPSNNDLITFHKYVYNILQFTEKSLRVNYVRDTFKYPDLLDFWFNSLQCQYSIAIQDKRCQCGALIELVGGFEDANTPPSLSLDLPSLLEECFPSNEDIQLAALNMSTEASLIRRLSRSLDSPEQKQRVIRQLLLSDNVNQLHQLCNLLAPEDWLYLLQQRISQNVAQEQNSLKCHWCGTICHRKFPLPPISKIAEVMLSSISPLKCLDILSSVTLPEDCLPLQFFQSCLVKHQEQIHQREQAEGGPNGPDADVVDAGSDMNLDPQMIYLIEKEFEINKDSDEADQSKALNQPVWLGLLYQNYNHLESMYNSHLPTIWFFTELNQSCDYYALLSENATDDGGVQRHWGKRLPVCGAVCPFCGLQLFTASNQAAVRVFYCGHYSHEECNPENLCQQCTQIS